MTNDDRRPHTPDETTPENHDSHDAPTQAFATSNGSTPPNPTPAQDHTQVFEARGTAPYQGSGPDQGGHQGQWVGGPQGYSRPDASRGGQPAYGASHSGGPGNDTRPMSQGGTGQAYTSQSYNGQVGNGYAYGNQPAGQGYGPNQGYAPTGPDPQGPHQQGYQQYGGPGHAPQAGPGHSLDPRATAAPRYYGQSAPGQNPYGNGQAATGQPGNGYGPPMQDHRYATTSPTEKPAKKKRGLLMGCGALALLLLLIIIAVAMNSGGKSSSSPSAAASSPATSGSASASVAPPSPSSAGAASDSASAAASPSQSGQVASAIKAARSYLDFESFSKQGLIDQLSSTSADKYPVAVATQAVNSLTDVNWDDQAKKSAESYLDSQAFSKQGLIDQLSSSSGDKFTAAQATTAVNSLTTDWNAQAVKAANEYLKSSPMSCSALKDQLSSEYGSKFTAAQAAFGAGQTSACK